jgi:hypothetical protein
MLVPSPLRNVHTRPSSPICPRVTGFDDARALYGNEILNGQGSSSDWRIKTGQLRGQSVGLDNHEIPINPAVIARSAIKLRLPFADETLNAPILDLGSNAIFDDFGVNLIGSDYSSTSFQVRFTHELKCFVAL